MSEALAEKKTFSVVLSEKLDTLGTALPKDFNKPRFVHNALAVLNGKDFSKFSQAQIIAGLTRGAVLGVDFFNNECYLVPYGNELNYQTSYIGMQKLVKKYSIRRVKDISAEVVKEGDFFENNLIDNKRYITFKPVAFNPGKIIGAFAMITFEDGDVIVDTMSLDELENTRRHSKMKDTGAWRDYTSEMYRKTVTRRLCKKVELDFDSLEQKEYFNDEAAIETDPEKEKERDIIENSNKVNFEFEDAVVKEVVE